MQGKCVAASFRLKVWKRNRAFNMYGVHSKHRYNFNISNGDKTARRLCFEPFYSQDRSSLLHILRSSMFVVCRHACRSNMTSVVYLRRIRRWASTMLTMRQYGFDTKHHCGPEDATKFAAELVSVDLGRDEKECTSMTHRGSLDMRLGDWKSVLIRTACENVRSAKLGLRTMPMSAGFNNGIDFEGSGSGILRNEICLSTARTRAAKLFVLEELRCHLHRYLGAMMININAGVRNKSTTYPKFALLPSASLFPSFSSQLAYPRMVIPVWAETLSVERDKDVRDIILCLLLLEIKLITCDASSRRRDKPKGHGTVDIRVWLIECGSPSASVTYFRGFNTSPLRSQLLDKAVNPSSDIVKSIVKLPTVLTGMSISSLGELLRAVLPLKTVLLNPLKISSVYRQQSHNGSFGGDIGGAAWHQHSLNGIKRLMSTHDNTFDEWNWWTYALIRSHLFAFICARTKYRICMHEVLRLPISRELDFVVLDVNFDQPEIPMNTRADGALPIRSLDVTDASASRGCNNQIGRTVEAALPTCAQIPWCCPTCWGGSC